MDADAPRTASPRIDDAPSDERKAVLEAWYQQNITQDKAPYDRVQITTYGELLWVFEQRNWSGVFRWSEGKHRPNLSGASLERVNLSGASLERANLSGAQLFQADLSGAHLHMATLNETELTCADLSGADLANADMTRAHLLNANLSGAHLLETNLSRAHMLQANLSGANLQKTNLSGAYLTRVKFDTDTNLSEIILSSTTSLGDIRWNGVNLTQINWEPVQHLGDDDIEHPDVTARAYRQIATQLRSQGMNEVADRFAYLAQLWQRRIMRQRLHWTNLHSLGLYLGSWLLWAISGYGYRSSRIFAAYLLTVGSFAAAYYAVTHTVETQLAKLSWDEALVLSLTSFHGRGFLPGFLALGDWVARIGALEAVIGLFIELILIATFSRRFLGN